MEEKLEEQLRKLKDDLCSTLDLITPEIVATEALLKGLPIVVHLPVLTLLGQQVVDSPSYTDDMWESVVSQHLWYTLMWNPSGRHGGIRVRGRHCEAFRLLTEASGEIRLDVMRQGRLKTLVQEAISVGNLVLGGILDGCQSVAKA